MKKIFFLSYLLIMPLWIFAQKIEVYPSYARFYTPDGTPYVETFLAINSNGVTFIGNDKGTTSASIQVLTTFSKDKKIVAFSKYNITSPERTASDTVEFTFINQQRTEVPAGKYEISIELTDANQKDNVVKFNDSIEIPSFSGELFFSDFELLEKYSKSNEPNTLTKSGFDLVPFLSNFFPSKMNELKFYCEIYNSDKVFGTNSQFLVSYFIRVFETQKLMNGMSKSKKVTSAPVSVLLAEIPIQELPSGNYELVVEVRDRNNNLVRSSTMFFQRSNPMFKYQLADVNAISTENTWVDNFVNPDSLMDCIYSLRPISNPSELTFVDNNFKKKGNDIALMKKYFLRFWEARSAADSEGLWKVYAEEVKKVNKAYGTKISKGYATDRGRVYLQYGPPNQIAKNNFDPNAIPYEIWHYYKLNTQRNKKFVFASQELATNDMELVHSDAAGEYTDKNWVSKIRDNNSFKLTGNEKIEQGGTESSFGERFRQSFLNPY